MKQYKSFENRQEVLRKNAKKLLKPNMNKTFFSNIDVGFGPAAHNYISN